MINPIPRSGIRVDFAARVRDMSISLVVVSCRASYTAHHWPTTSWRPGLVDSEARLDPLSEHETQPNRCPAMTQSAPGRGRWPCLQSVACANSGRLMDDSQAEMLAFRALPKGTLAERSGPPTARADQQGDQTPIPGRRDLPNHAALVRLVGAILADMHDEWQAGDRRYRSDQSMDLLYPEGNNQPALRQPPPTLRNAKPAAGSRLSSVANRMGVEGAYDDERARLASRPSSRGDPGRCNQHRWQVVAVGRGPTDRDCRP